MKEFNLSVEHRITKKVFLWDCSLNYNNWSSEIFKIIDSVDLHEEILFNLNINVIKEKIERKTCETLVENISHKPKLRTYVKFKSIYKVEKYVMLNLSRSQRSLIAQFRMGVLPLRIETGRFRHEPLTDRLCRFCNMNVIEDECHFLFDCHQYDEIRQQYLGQIFATIQGMQNEEKLEYLFSGPVRQFANFVEKAFYRRREILYV